MKNVRPVISLKTALGITGFEKFNPAIPNESLESNIDKFSCKLIVSTVSIGRCSTANIMPLRHRPQKRVLNKKELIVIWAIFLQMKWTQLFLIILIIKLWSWLNNYLKTCVIITNTHVVHTHTFWYLICNEFARTKFSKIEIPFSVGILSLNRLVFINTMI